MAADAMTRLFETMSLSLGVDMSNPLAAQSYLAEMKADLARGDTRCVGSLFTRPENFRQPKGDLASAIQKAASENGINSVNMSAALLPRMTMEQCFKWKAKLFKRIESEPDTIFFVTVDNISATEAILAFDSDIKNAALSSGMAYQGFAQGIVWRGEDYVRLAGIDSDLSVVKHGMSTILAGSAACEAPRDYECVVCLETMTEEITAAAGGSKFTCAHVICVRCGSAVSECPICRNKKVPRR